MNSGIPRHGLGARPLLFVVLLGAWACPVAPARAEAVGRPPNVILILSDDHGSADVGCYGAADLHTPHLDALAARGVRFTQFYVAASVCSPSRAALLTGRQPIRAGVPGNVSSRRGAAGMPPGEVTVAELLKDRLGYRTALFGKWHLGTTPDGDPLGQGFDEFFGHLGGCVDNWSHTMYWEGPIFHDLWRGRDEVWENGTHFGDLIVREATRFIGENRDRPFFLFLPFNAPHYPCQAPERILRRYADVPEPRRSYAAALTTMDEQIGAVLARLDELAVREDTLVIFLGDHGHSTEERAGFGGGSAGPLRGAKFSLFEGGLRVPCVVSWPGKIAEGQTRDTPASSMDWLPTIAEWAGAEPPAGRTLDGRSLVPLLSSAEAEPPHDAMHWQLGDQWAVRAADWKLIVNALDTTPGGEARRSPGPFLANLAQDPSESRDVASDHPDVVKRLTILHESWAAQLRKP
jgi:arylsulfatase A-like enzyme